MTTMVQDLTKGRSVFSSFNHPLMQAQMWGMPALYEWQSEIIEEASRPGARVAVSTNNGSGKTSVLVPLLGLSIMAAFPGATVFSTAGAVEQIKGQLFSYLDSMVRPFIDDGWKCAISDELSVTAPRVRGLQSRWIARVPRDAITMEGYHGKWDRDSNGDMCWRPVCVIIDEAKSVGLKAFEAAWRIEPDFLFVISTPGDDVGPFYDAIDPDTLDGGQKRDPGALWHYRRKITRRDCPHLQTPEKIVYLDQLIEKFGARSSFIKSFSEGEFQRDTDENSVFTDTDLKRVKASMKQRVEYNPGRKFAGLDFSSGGDEQVMMVLDGDKVIYEKIRREEDTDKLAIGFLLDLRRFEIPARDCIADNGGIGYGIIDNMEGDGVGKGYRGIRRYMNNQDPINGHEYADRITEDHYQFKELLRLHPEVQLPDDPVLLKQMRQRRFIVNEHNKIKLERKRDHRKRTNESPDRLDTLIMLFSDWKPPKGAKKEPRVYHSTLEEEARRKSGLGAQAPFGWVRPQQDMFRRIVNQNKNM